jgi:hypothetical protein
MKTTAEENKALVLKAFDTLFNKRDYEAAASWSFHNLGDVTAFKKGPNQDRAFRHSF